MCEYEEEFNYWLSGKSDLEAGIVLHAVLRDKVESRETDWEVEFMLDGEKGRVDCIDKRDWVPYEIKTKNQRGMELAPYTDDVQQLEEYIHALGESVGFLIYIDRETLDVDDYPVIG